MKSIVLALAFVVAFGGTVNAQTKYDWHGLYARRMVVESGEVVNLQLRYCDPDRPSGQGCADVTESVNWLSVPAGAVQRLGGGRFRIHSNGRIRYQHPQGERTLTLVQFVVVASPDPAPPAGGFDYRIQSLRRYPNSPW